MINLVKIQGVKLYVGFRTEQGAADCVRARKLLDEKKIPYSTLHYADAATHDDCFTPLNTWTFGPDFRQTTFTDFPFVIWTELYDDYERYQEVAQGIQELIDSNLLKNTDKIE